MINNCNTLPLCASFYRLHFNTIVHFQDDNKYVSTLYFQRFSYYSLLWNTYRCQRCSSGDELFLSWIIALNTISCNLYDDLIFAITFTSHINKCTEIVSSKIFLRFFFLISKNDRHKSVTHFPHFHKFCDAQKKPPHIRCNMCD